MLSELQDNCRKKGKLGKLMDSKTLQLTDPKTHQIEFQLCVFLQVCELVTFVQQSLSGIFLRFPLPNRSQKKKRKENPMCITAIAEVGVISWLTSNL